jgi:ubiquinone/menaquinone biosynthesis C-methylase UbiE
MDFQFPVPPGYSEEPVWTGNDFLIGIKKVQFLQYNKNDEGWNANLTNFHEKENESGNHYTDRASRRHVLFELEKCVLPTEAVILEIGISSGYLLREIRKTFPEKKLIGSDCIAEPLEKNTRQLPGVPLIQFDLVQCPLPDNCVDVVIALNVLEHIKNDTRALQQIHRILKPGGYTILEVPANQELFDFYDEQLKHFRRYNIHELSDRVQKLKFTIMTKSHLGFFVYPTFAYIKHQNKKMKFKTEIEKLTYMKTLIQLGGPTVNKIGYFVMLFEIYLGKIIHYPVGIRCLLTLKKEP